VPRGCNDRRIAPASEEAPLFQSIVVGTDGSETAEEAVRQAADLARSAGARLDLVAAYPGPQPIWERLEGSARTQPVDLRRVAEELLLRAAQQIEGDGLEVNQEAREGDAASVLIDVAREQHADLIVVGDRGGTAVRRFLLGSVPNKISHHAPCSVMIVRPTI
jgi:nucleotide-binding universal stress UspA family protein